MSTNGQLVFTDVDKITFKGVGNTSNAVVDTVTGKIGVGIDSPDANLHVLGNSYVSTNLELGGTLIMGTVNVEAQHSLEAITATGNTTPLTIEFSNATTGIVTTGNVEVGGELTVVSNVNMLHTANTATLKINSNVVTEFPRSKKLMKFPRVAIANGTLGPTGGIVQTPGVSGSQDGFVATSSSSWGNGGADSRGAWCAFDEGTSSTTHKIWQSGNYYTTATPGVYNRSPPQSHTAGGVNYEGEWIKLELPHKINVSTIEINSAAYSTLTGHHTARPYEGAILASNDDTNWSLLKSFSDGLDWTTTTVAQGGSRATLTPNTNTTNYYRYIMLVVNKIQGSRSSVDINEIRYYGYLEHDTEADGVDVTVKSLPNVPNTDWLEVYYDAKGLTPGAVGSSISGLGGTTISATKLGDPQVSNDAFVFDGSGDAIVSGATSLIGNPPLSYSVWFKTNSISSGSGSNSIVQIGHSADDKSLGFRIRGLGETNKPGNYRFYVWGGATNEPVDTNIKAEIGTWTHATVVYNGLNSKLYIDGKFVAENTNTTTDLDLASGAKVALGNYIDSNGALYSGGTVRDYDGSIANFRLFNRVITTDEIYQLYAYQKEYFGHGDLSLTLKAGRLGIGTSEPKATLDIRGEVLINGYQLTSMYPGFATGGDDVYDIDGYRIHVFTTSGTFVVPGNKVVTDILLVGGGGGGGQDNAGGGGAGGLIFKPGHTFEGRSESNGRDGAYTIVIGSGGAGSTEQNSDAPDPGGDTYIRPLNWRTQGDYYGSTPITRGTFTNIFTAKGGGPGNNGGQAPASTINGGSGGGQDGEIRTGQGGGVATQPTQSGDSGTYGYGNNGGNSASEAGGGGGGAGKVGESAGSGATLGLYYGGYGGDGLSGVPGYDFAEIFGTKYGEVVDEDVYFAGGGAGANKNTSSSGSFTSANGYALGGKGGGGSAGGTPETNEDGLPGTGGGGAGATWVTNPTYYINHHGGNGGSGIAMIRYRL